MKIEKTMNEVIEDINHTMDIMMEIFDATPGRAIDVLINEISGGAIDSPIKKEFNLNNKGNIDEQIKVLAEILMKNGISSDQIDKNSELVRFEKYSFVCRLQNIKKLYTNYLEDESIDFDSKYVNLDNNPLDWTY